MVHAPTPERTLLVDRLLVELHSDRGKLGAAAAHAVAERMRTTIAENGSVAMVFASAPSQNEFLATLATLKGIDWDKVTAFHMDEYLGLPADSPEGFGTFLQERLYNAVKPGTVHFLNGQAEDPQAECKRYAALLAEHPVDIVCAGIGENGHLAFNDPPVADFEDPESVKVVELDHACRLQQVHDGCFPNLNSVPTHALTLTIPALTAASWIYAMVPGPTKAQAIKDTLTAPLGTHCPATILRQHPRAVLYVDTASAALL
jgi:glucosamine-6-phosphate deaminase